MSQTIRAVRSRPESPGTQEKADFILAFWMIHEVPDPRSFLCEVRTLLKPGGRFLLVEPMVHTSKKHFNRLVQTAAESGFAIRGNPRIRFSRSVLLG